MAYSTGSATSPDDLLDKIRAFLLANGWTINLFAIDNTTYRSLVGMDGSGKRLHVQKTASGGDIMYFNLRSIIRGCPFGDVDGTSATTPSGKYYVEMTGIALNGSTGYNVANAWDLQPGYTGKDGEGSGLSWGVATTDLSTSAIPSYYLFEDGDTVIIAVEYESGKFQWLIFGCLEKEGVYTGGQFFSGSLSSYVPQRDLEVVSELGLNFYAKRNNYGNGAIRLDADSITTWRSSGAMGSNATVTTVTEKIMFPAWPPKLDNDGNYEMRNCWGAMFYRRSPNELNSLAPMLPCHTMLVRADGNTSLLGHPKNLRIINMKFYDPGDEFTYGGDTYIVLPAHAKTDGDGDDTNPTLRNYVGFAVKKVI